MKILGLLIAIVIMGGYCAYNSTLVNSADVNNADTESSSIGGCEGPFGADSQKILNDDVKSPEYEIGMVSKVDLEKNDDGTWYVHSCKMKLIFGSYTLYFTSPYPQQNDLKEGDIIGFTAKGTIREGSLSYHSGKMVEHISSQSVKCKIDDMNGLSTPSYTMPSFEKDFVNLTGVIIAVQTEKNPDPEPDNPSDYLITKVVMKFSDGKLYIVDFGMNNFMYEGLRKRGLPTEIPSVNLPDQDAFGEGDVVTVTQTSSAYVSEPMFSGYYKQK